MSNTFNTGDIIHSKYTDVNNGYYYVVLDRFSNYQYEYYNLFSLLQGKEVTLQVKDSEHYQVVSSVSS